MRRWCLVLLWVLLCAWMGLAQAAISIDTITISGGTGDFGSDTFAHTTAANANVLLVCSVIQGWATGDGTLTGVTYNADALTELATAAELTVGHVRTHAWFRLAPDPGTHDVVVDQNGDGWYINVALTLKDVAQSTPTNTDTASGVSVETPSLTVPSDAGHLVVDCLGWAAGGNTFDDPIEGSGQTPRWFAHHDSVIAHVGSTMEGASPSVTPEWTLQIGGSNAGTAVAHVGVSFAPLTEAPTGRRRSILVIME